MFGHLGNFLIPLAQTFPEQVFRVFLNSDRYRLRFQKIEVVFDMYMVMRGNYILLGLAVWQEQNRFII